MRFHRLPALFIAALLVCAGCTPEPMTPGQPLASQGWSDADRQEFYTTGQGSRLIPYPWFRALRRLDADAGFGADALQRYGYLPNAASAANPEKLPVGFTLDGPAAGAHLGMTCAACHTARIEYRGQALRIDGGRANADFQAFLTDLTATARATRDTPARFDNFATGVLGANPTDADKAKLRQEFAAWVTAFGEFMDKSLPHSPWGPGRLDAFGMIFNRVTSLDLNIPANMAPADAPVRYPFLWDATRQDKTQWNGAAPNGLYLLGLIRNTGEVMGVFAQFNPHRAAQVPGLRPMLRYDSSVDMRGLQTLEEKIAKLRPPSWPREMFGYDQALADKGKAIFNSNCVRCHAQETSKRIPNSWATLLQDVGTDPRMATNAGRMGETGIMAGTTPSALIQPPLGAQAPKAKILASAVIGTVLQQAEADLFPPDAFLRSGVWDAVRQDFDDLAHPAADMQPPAARQSAVRRVEQRLGEIYARPGTKTSDAAYEARFLSGIWAVGPYLHNGAVPNLWALLQPAAARPTRFMVGSREFDPKNVGFATDRSPFNATFVVDATNGNGNGGHEYGTALSEADKWALIEYMKGL